MENNKYLIFSMGCDSLYAMHTRDIIEITNLPADNPNTSTLNVHDRLVTILDVCDTLAPTKPGCNTCDIRGQQKQIIVVRLTGSDTHFGFKINSAVGVADFPLDKINTNIPNKNGMSVLDGAVLHDEKFVLLVNEQSMAQMLVGQTAEVEGDIELF